MRPVEMIAAVAMSLMLIGAAFAQDRVDIPGTPVSLVPPPGFELNPRTTGLINRRTSSDIIVGVLPAGTYGQVSEAFADLEKARTGFADQGIKIETLESLPRKEGQTLTLIHGTQTIGTIVIDKWIALAGPEPTVIIGFNINPLDPVDDATIRASFASIEIGGAVAPADQVAELPYSFTPQPPFGALEVTAGAAVSVRTPAAAAGGQGGIFVLSWQLTGGPVSVASAIAEEQLKKVSFMQKVAIEKSEPLTFAGVPGVRLSGTHEQAGAPMRFVYYLSVINRSYVVALGVMPVDQADVLLPVIESMAQSVLAR